MAKREEDGGTNPDAAAAAEANEVPDRPLPGAPAEHAIALPAGGVMPTRPLGRTGVQVSLVGVGGYHLGLCEDDATATRIVRMAIDHGATFMDNCWDYNDGLSHRRMGAALQDGYRQRAFLMTKIDGRTRDAAAAQIDQSLRDLRTDVIDLVQIHEVIRREEPEQVFAPGGAIEALVEARQAGKLRFVGFTGHKSPAIHLAMLAEARERGFRFDAVQLPLNLMDAHYDSFERLVLPELVGDGIGALGMKPLGSGLFFKSRPLREGAVTATDCLQYAMALPVSVVITGCDTVGILKQALAAAFAFAAGGAPDLDALRARTRPVARDGAWEKYKTTALHDGTSESPWWLTTASLAQP